MYTSTHMTPLFVSYNDIHRYCQDIAARIENDGWQPDCIVAIAGGGLIPARMLRTFLKIPIYVVGLQRYDDATIIAEEPQTTQWLDNAEKKLHDKHVLVVDEVDDTRVTLSHCTRALLEYQPRSIRIAVLHQKQKPKTAELPVQVEVVYAAQVVGDDWINYPWEAQDIDEHDTHIG